MKRSSLLPKLAIALAAIASFGYLFLHSLESTRSEPYPVARAHLAKWTLVLEPAEGPNAPLLSARADHQLVARLFQQLFARVNETMSSPATSSIPVVLHGEFDRGLAGRMTPAGLLAAARAAGLESAAHEPRCVAYRRISEPGSTRQTYFAIVDSPAIVGFRQQLARSGEGAFDAAALTPIMFIGATDPVFHRWLPIRAGEQECVAPIQIGQGQG
jgi:hypothetical protein